MSLTDLNPFAMAQLTNLALEQNASHGHWGDVEHIYTITLYSVHIIVSHITLSQNSV